MIIRTRLIENKKEEIIQHIWLPFLFWKKTLNLIVPESHISVPEFNWFLTYIPTFVDEPSLIKAAS